MHLISAFSATLLLIIFGIGTFIITYLFGRWGQWRTKDGFLVAHREVGWLWGGLSIAASWIWAPALFVSVQLAYQKGLAGIFWFTVPNILSLTIFALLAPKIRDMLPEGYTLPQFIRYKLQSERVHRVYLFPFFFYQLMAVTVQLFAGGSLVALLTGISLPTVMIALTIIVLSYTIISGLEGSLITDLIQLITIFAVGIVILPFAIKAAGGNQALLGGLGGVEGIKSILDPAVAFSFGIVTSIGLIAGSISDQSNWQRAFAIKKAELKKAFIFASLIFGVVPISLSLLGFIAANPAQGITLPAGVDVSMIGVQTIAHLLPSWAVFLFAIAFLSILCSALDAGLCAASSLWVTDIKPPKDDDEAVSSARKSMIGTACAGLLLALAVLYIPHVGLQQLWWVFNTIAACIVVPTVLSLYWDGLSERGVFWGVLAAFFLGIPMFIYANIVDKPMWVVWSSLFIIFISTVFCVAMPKKSQGQIVNPITSFIP
ncbi:MAG: Sodium/glucose cotransporter [Candidatus Parcubacteria bacterium]|jgi:Na+/proline symporter